MKFKLSAIAVAVAAATLATGASAASIDFHGYGRSGVGSSDKGGSMVCYNIGGGNNSAAGQHAGSMSHFRLGNECDTYLELGLDANLAEKAGSAFKLHTMLAGGTQQLTDWEQTAPAWRQLWIEGTNIGSGPLASASLWVGKRYYRQDIHMLDLRYIDLDGPGAGIENIDLGFAKLSYHLNVQAGDANWNSQQATTTNSSGAVTGVSVSRWLPDYPATNAGNTQTRTHALRLEGVSLGDFGSLDFHTNFIQASARNGATKAGNGFWFTGQHTIGVLGGFNRAFIQYARNAAEIDGEAKTWFGPSNGVSYTAWRVMDHLVFDIGQFNGSAVIGYMTDKGYTWYQGASTKTFTAGVRGWYHFNDLYALGGELGSASFKNVNYAGGNAPTQNLTKFTVAGQMSAGKGFWARPALRAYYTYAHFNDAAYSNGVSCTGRDCGTHVGLGNNVTSGSTWGLQAEAWW